LTYLLDVCVLIALGDHGHAQHLQVYQWVADVRRGTKEVVSFATCAVTELGFVRIATTNTNAGFADDVEAAKAVLRRIKRHLPFVFLGDELGAEQLPAWVTKSTQTTDGHLLELARTHQAQLATLDTGIPGALLIPDLSNSGWRVEEPSVRYGTAA
jgi:uncharacterized protein